MNAPGYGLTDRARVIETLIAGVDIGGQTYLFLKPNAARDLAKVGFFPRRPSQTRSRTATLSGAEPAEVPPDKASAGNHLGGR